MLQNQKVTSSCWPPFSSCGGHPPWMKAGKDAHVPASEQLLLWVRCCVPLISAKADVPGYKQWHSFVYSHCGLSMAEEPCGQLGLCWCQCLRFIICAEIPSIKKMSLIQDNGVGEDERGDVITQIKPENRQCEAFIN